MNPLQALLEQGQSVWYDFISRDFIQSGEMKRLVDSGLRGMTSNPTIFEKAIAAGDWYDQQIQELARAGAETGDIATELFIADVRSACDLMLPVFESAERKDGFISIEVSPRLAANTEATIEEARRLWKEIARPNLMVKIPATDEGIPAIRQCISEGISVNITLMFSLEQYRAVAEAYIGGLEARVAAGGDISSINSVASVFVSRIDTMIDPMLEKIGTPQALELRGKAALANTKLTYKLFTETFSGKRWEALEAKGANLQRPLWASTSVKNPAYSDLLYVENLVGPHTVNTVPPETLTAIMDHYREIHRTIEQNVGEAQQTLNEISACGVNLEEVMHKLIEEGVQKFSKSFDALFQKIDEKRGVLAGA